MLYGYGIYFVECAFMAFLGTLSFSLHISIASMCMVVLAPTIMTMSRSTFHPLLIRVLNSD